MAEKCFPLNDTNYLADDLQMWFAGRTHGVLCLEENLMVDAQKGMKITLHKGHAFLRTGIENKGGVMYFNEANLEFTLDVADSILDRIDTVCIRYDKIENTCYAYIQKGIPSNQPVAMKPKRDAAYFEIVVAQIRIPKGIGEITSLHISDKRMDEEVCGLIKDNIERIPTQILYNQFQSFMDETKNESEDWKNLRDKEYTQWYDAIKELFANRIVDIDVIITTQTDKFHTWFDGIKGKLGDDLAGNLQLQIDDITPRIIKNENNISQLTNPNLLVNGDFQIWQRGEVINVYNGNTYDYGPDRWNNRLRNQKMEKLVNDGPVVVAFKNKITKLDNVVNRNGIVIQQFIEDYACYTGSTLTISFWAKPSKDSTVSVGVFGRKSKLISIKSNEWNYVHVTIKDIPATENIFVISSLDLSEIDDVLEIAAVKLELGNQATPFIPKPYSEELRQCQRYFIKDYIVQGFPYANRNETNYYYMLDGRFNTEMRIIPSMKINSMHVSNIGDITHDSIDGDMNKTGMYGTWTIDLGRVIEPNHLFTYPMIIKADFDAEIY